MKITYDQWNGIVNNGEEIYTSIFSEIERLIKRMDQSIYTQVIINQEESYLLIGGGKGKYIVTLVIGNDDDFYTLVNDDENISDNEIDIVTGGQLGSFPSKMAINYDLTIIACRYYFEQKVKDPKLKWVNE